MSRRITITSDEIQEVDLAEEVIAELGIRTLSFNKDKSCFENQQFDDVKDNSIQRAEQLYYEKRKARNTSMMEKNLKKENFKVKVAVSRKDGKTKIVGVQRVYA